MAILSNLYTKSNNYNYTLTLAGIVPVTGFYKTALTCTNFIRCEKIEAVKTKITDTPRMVITWPKPKNGVTKYQLTLQGILEAKQVAQVQPIKLTGTKASPTKKAPVLTIVAPLNATTAVIATEQNAEPAKSSSSDDGGESGEEPDHEDALKRLMAQLEYDLALDLEEELEESECELEESGDWAEDAEIQTTKTSNNGLVKPKATTPLFDNTPQYLQDKKHWLLWEYMFNEGRWTKVPLQCNKSHAKTNDPTTWASFEEVKTAYLSGGFDGVGIAFADDGTTGIDIDKCFTVANNEKVWDETKKQYVEEILNAFQGKAYFELSPSKTGFHIICNGKALRSGKAQRVINGAKANWIELYTYPSSRYFTFTGDVAIDLTGAPLDCQVDLDWLDKAYMTVPKVAKKTSATNNNLDVTHATEDLLSVIGSPNNVTSYLFNYGLAVKKINDLTNEFKVERRLWQATNLSTGKELKVGDVFRFTDNLSINKDKLTGDHSSVDLALCSKLAFFTNRNAQQMDELFRLSCLMRPKWDELRGSYTYGDITIQKAIRAAIENNAEVYKSGKPKSELVEPTLFNTTETGIPNIDLNDFAFSGFSNAGTEDGEAFVADKIHKVFTTDVRDGTAKTRPLTELGNAYRLKDKYADDVKFAIGHSLIHWGDGCWKWDSDKAMTRSLAAELPMDIYAESVAYPQFIQQFANWSRASQSEAKIKNVVSLYTDFPEVRIPFNFIDGDIFKVGLANSTKIIDLKTGLVRHAERNDYITQTLNVEEVGEANKATRWLVFLNEVFGDDSELIAWFKMWCGYLLTGSTREQCFVFLYGFGSNGKGVLTKIINTILGDYSTTVGSETFTDTKRQAGAASPDIAKLCRARLVLSTETNEGVALSEALVKTITGEDMLSARFLNKEEFEFMPQFKVMMSGNHKPVIRGTDNGIWRRVKLLPFTRVFEEKEKDVTLTATLLTEAPHILAWMIDGCLEWQKIGLSKTPKIISDATAEYRAEQDILGLWLDEECETGAEHSQDNASLYLNYKLWCEKNSNKPASNKTFSQRLNERGFDKRKSHGKMYWSGIKTAPLIFQDFQHK